MQKGYLICLEGKVIRISTEVLEIKNKLFVLMWPLNNLVFYRKLFPLINTRLYCVLADIPVSVGSLCTSAPLPPWLLFIDCTVVVLLWLVQI